MNQASENGAGIDALIIGAGPVGLTLAAELTRYGLKVRIIDKAPKATDKSKALVLWSRTLELIDRMGCTSKFLAAGMNAHGASITAGDKQLAHFTFSQVKTPYPFALMIPQCETERLLAEHLRTLGVEVERGVELLNFTAEGCTTETATQKNHPQSGAKSPLGTPITTPETTPSTTAEPNKNHPQNQNRGCSAKIRHPDGHEEEVETPYILGCDGAHSTVRHTLGVPFEGNTEQSDWILADAHLTGVPRNDEISIMWHADGVLALFPIGGDRFRMVADLGIAKGEARRNDPTLDEIQTVLDQRGPGGIKASNPIWLASFRINERKVKEYRHGQVFLLGDAAHIHSPAGGQGMNTGMQDAFNLAWKLALVTRGADENLLLDSYSIERSGVGDQVLTNASRLTTMATLRGGVKQTIRNHIASLVFGLASVRKNMADTMSEVTIGYPESHLNALGDRLYQGPAPGERAPIRDGEPPVGAGNTPRFALFASAAKESAALLAEHADWLEPQHREPFHPDGIWLVRPDGYVSVATGLGDWHLISEFLKKLKAS